MVGGFMAKKEKEVVEKIEKVVKPKVDETPVGLKIETPKVSIKQVGIDV